MINRQETAAGPLPDQVGGGQGGGDDAGVVGGSRHRVRPGGGSADDTEAATHGGSDDGGVAQLLQKDCPVKHSTRYESATVFYLYLTWDFVASEGVLFSFLSFSILKSFLKPLKTGWII